MEHSHIKRLPSASMKWLKNKIKKKKLSRRRGGGGWKNYTVSLYPLTTENHNKENVFAIDTGFSLLFSHKVVFVVGYANIWWIWYVKKKGNYFSTNGFNKIWDTFFFFPWFCVLEEIKKELGWNWVLRQMQVKRKIKNWKNYDLPQNFLELLNLFFLCNQDFSLLTYLYYYFFFHSFICMAFVSMFNLNFNLFAYLSLPFKNK